MLIICQLQYDKLSVKKIHLIHAISAFPFTFLYLCRVMYGHVVSTAQFSGVHKIVVLERI